MLEPAAMFIESAIDMLKDGSVPDVVRATQVKELQFATGNHDPRFAQGYELGLQTARVILAGSVALALKGVKPGDVL
jgi:hypothetical protein